MTDYVRLLLSAGAGGRGKVSFRREKRVPKGGPDGGNGGSGGDVIIRASSGVVTLREYAGVAGREAKPGQPGGGSKSSGKAADPIVLEVPLGTVVWHIAENRVGHMRRMRHGMDTLLVPSEVRQQQYTIDKENPEHYVQAVDATDQIEEELLDYNSKMEHSVQLCELIEDGQEFVVCQGGFGGRGNDSFKSSTNQTPMNAELGTPGEQRFVALELKLLAEVGLVGFPSVGKSTLLSVLTKARPKIAAYPFTTLEPNLGIAEIFMGSDKADVVIADIPGLIEGASIGKGLGFEFLRHVDHCKALLFVLALDEHVAQNDHISDEDKAQMLWQQFEQLQHELEKYKPELLEKDIVIGINKIDIPIANALNILSSIAKQKSIDVIPFSAVTGEGIESLKKALVSLVAT